MTDAPSAPDRRGFLRVVGPGLLAGALALVAAGRDWGTASITSPGRREVTVPGSEVVPLLVPLALVALASWGAFLVLRTAGRRVVAVIGLIASGGATVASVLSVGDVQDRALALLSDASGADASTTAWPWAALVGAAISTLCFAVALLKAPTYPQMSRRYDTATGAPAEAGGEAKEPTEADLWKALDDGRDPTV